MAPEEGRVAQHFTTSQPSSNITSAAVEQNRTLLNTLFKFKKDSNLKEFVKEKTGREKACYTLAEILKILKDVISKEKMFDSRNAYVILCSKSLERALNQKALHVTEVRELVLEQVERVTEQKPRVVPRPNQAPANVTSGVQQRPSPNPIQYEPKSKHRLKPAFLEVLRSVQDPQCRDQEIFTYEEVTLLLSKYILSKKDQIFDQRNIKLALVANDPLGKAFGVTAFHRCQVNMLLKSQLIPILSIESPPLFSSHPPQAPSNSPSLTPSPSSSLPAFPALTKAASLPCQSLLVPQLGVGSRKRSNSGDGLEGDSRQEKQSKLNQCSVIVRKSGESEESETETIYSEQGYETIKASGVNDEEDEATSSMSAEEGGNPREEFDVEYDIDSGDEEERPPQAHGAGREFSSADDTDTDVDEKHRAIAAVANVIETVYWGDSEQEKVDDDKLDKEVKRESMRKCLNCREPSTLVQYCSRCWESRKGWNPDRPKKRRKNRSSRKNPEPTNTETILSDVGIDEIDGHTDRPRSDTMYSQDSGIGSQEMIEFPEEETVADNSNRAPLNLTRNFKRTLSLDVTSSSSGSSNLDSLESVNSASDLRAEEQKKKCIFCEVRPMNATFVHGRLGHQVCCYPCAKKTWKKNPRCPICNMKVERIIKIIQS